MRGTNPVHPDKARALNPLTQEYAARYLSHAELRSHVQDASAAGFQLPRLSAGRLAIPTLSFFAIG